MAELKEVFVWEKHSDQSKQTSDDIKQYESETHFLMPPKPIIEVESRESYPEGENRLVFMETDSSDDFKKVGVREFPFSIDTSFPIRPKRREFMRRILDKGSESGPMGSKDTQVKFSDVQMAEEIVFPSDESVEESIPVRKVNNFTPKLSYVRERPSTIDANLVALSENLIKLSVTQEFEVSSVDGSHQDWEIDSNFNVMKILKPSSTTPIKAKRESTQTKPIETENAVEDNNSISSSIKNEEQCCEFLNPVAAAKLFITDTLTNAKEAYRKIVSMYGDPDRWSVRSATKPTKISSRWPQIKNFTEESGLYCIESYIVSCSRFQEDWKYTIYFQDMKEDNVSDHYYYEVLFNTEISGYQIDPENYTLKDNVLLRILDMKVFYFKGIYF